MGFIKDWIHKYFYQTAEERRRSEVWREAYNLAEQGKYTEAAEVNARHALVELKENELLYSSYCENAFEMWIKAQEPGNALREARNVLRVIAEGEWLKDYPAERAEELMAIVSRFFAAGYTAEAVSFAGEVNHQFEKYNLPMRCAAVPVRKNVFPASCSDCGANLSHNPYQETTQCGYCKTIIYALDYPPKTGDADEKF